jgi:prepilin-type N-terminal cleavage/methylation domain-containing protein
MKRFRNRTQRSPQRSAFTLLEVLIAVALTSSLLVAIYAALNLFWQTQRTGREEMARSQIARSVLSMMSRDIRSVVFVLPEAEESEDESAEDSESSDTDSDDSTSTEPVEEEVAVVESASDAVAAPELALYGDANSLVLQISRPSRGMVYSSPSAGGPVTGRSSDLLKVSYFLADPNASGLGSVVSTSTSSASTLSPVEGLARLEGDKFVVDLADSQGDQDTLAELTQVLAPEINSVQFTYYDGGVAYESWDSTLYGKLPAAIEIVIGFRTTEDLSQLERLSGYGAVPVATYRLVVALPMSQPYVVQDEI